jgi:hypothetical protein
VTFDDEKVKIEEIVKLLDWGHFPVKGTPEFLN